MIMQVVLVLKKEIGKTQSKELDKVTLAAQFNLFYETT